MTASTRTGSLTVLLVLGMLFLPACGGGGGGGGGGGTQGGNGGPTDPPDTVSLTGISFRVSPTITTSNPPLEDALASPPSLGGPLSTVVVFNFTGVPSGPFTQTTLPVFTTPEDISPTIGAVAGLPFIPAKGTYALVGNTVEFTPFVPLSGFSFSINGPPDKVPGFFPGSVYTVQVSTSPIGKITNLVGAGQTVKFGTTSNEAAFFPQDPDAGSPPVVVASVPGEGAGNFFPGVFSNQVPGQVGDSFPSGPSSILLTYDRALLPTTSNISGVDLDGDGLVDSSFFLRTQATRLLIGQEVPANSLGPHAAFPAISGLTAGMPPAVNGDDVLLHGDKDGALGGPSAALDGGTPVSLALARDPDVLFGVLRVEGGSDLLTVGDRLLGDPGFAQLAENAAEGGPLGALPLGLADVVGLTTLVDGSLVAYDQATRRIYELQPVIVRRRASPEAEGETPLLLSLNVGDGVSGFRSEPVVAAGTEILDLASSVTGELYALAVLPGDTFPSVLRLRSIDPDANGLFGDLDGTFSTAAEDIVLGLSSAYADMTFIDDDVVLALNRSLDTIDRIDLGSGSISTEVTGVAAFEMNLGSFPDGLSPARALAVGFAELDLAPSLVSNEDNGALVQVEPLGILPVDAEVQVLQRNTLTSLFGSNLLVANPELDFPVLGAATVLRFSTAAPFAEGTGSISDVFLETFTSNALESDGVGSSAPKAEWAAAQPGGQTTGVLRASTGVSDTAMLGDFLPTPGPNFDPTMAYLRGFISTDTAGVIPLSETDLTTNEGNFREIVLSTDGQSFPLPNGATPGITTPVTIIGGRFSFRDFIVPAGVKLIVRGSNPFVVTATGRIEIAGMIDAKGFDGLRDDSFDSGFLPVRGGPPGPGAGRGGDAHPTLFNPNEIGSLNQYVTPEKAEDGFGPVVSSAGVVSFQPVGGQGAISTAGYIPVGGEHASPGGGFVPGGPEGFPDMPGFTNGGDGSVRSESHRPPGGGGGSFAVLGQPSHYGSGHYRVESSSTWFPFPTCDMFQGMGRTRYIEWVTYGNEQNFWSGLTPNTPLQCVYFFDDFNNPSVRSPAAAPGQAVFVDGDPENDYIGSGGELEVVIGGQGGGGGGTRVDSVDHSEWSSNRFGNPTLPGPIFYPLLFNGPFFSPTVYDSKGGGGGGGGGAVQLRSFGDIIIRRTGHIDASGGQGGGGEEIGNSQLSGGGGGGSGGAILLQAARDILIEADPTHTDAGYIDEDDDAEGASLDVSGGFGKDARNQSSPQFMINPNALQEDYGRGDGGQGGQGLIQLQAGAELVVEQGASLFAKQRALIKLGRWNGGSSSDEGEHTELDGIQGSNDPAQMLRYIDMLHYRNFRVGGDGPEDYYYTLNGAYPPIIEHDTGDMGLDIINESPPGSGQFWGDTVMMEHPDIPGLMVAEEPQPDRFFFDINDPRLLLLSTVPDTAPTIAINLRNAVDDYFDEVNEPELFKLYPGFPGIPFEADAKVPLSVKLEDVIIPRIESEIPLARSTGGVITTEVEGTETWDPDWLVTKLPVVHPSKTPIPLSASSRGVSEWIDFGAVTLRARSVDGRTPPFFAPVHGTFNEAFGGIPPDKKPGQVQTAGPVPQFPSEADFVKNGAFDPGLFGDPNEAPFNDIKVDAPDLKDAGSEEFSPVANAITRNAAVSYLFQGAYPIRAGSNVPDEETLTPWVANIVELDGFPLVRFQVVFDLDQDPGSQLSVESKRPAVDFVRIRPSY